jgi:hypothetical protein
MKPGTILAYLFGRREAILEVAANKAALWTGIVLVLLTAIARNYDQTHISESPVLWLFGSLTFSLVSGTWVFLVVCVSFATGEPEDRTPLQERWRKFMALFWMTAPIAWLYAIPVERFFESVTAAKSNVFLLAIVSFWRVLLMSRVVAVVLNVHHLKSLAVVLFAASFEVFAVSLSGGAFARSIAAGMGGMRNSPEEEILIGTMAFAFLNSLWIGATTFIALLCIATHREGKPVWGRPGQSQPLRSSRWLWMVAIGWVGLAIYPQAQLARNLQVEAFMSRGEYRAALDFMNKHESREFAPARPLPPKAYETSVFGEITELMRVIRTDDAGWIRQHVMLRFVEMCSHLGHEDPHRPHRHVLTADQQASQWLGHLAMPEGDVVTVLAGLNRIPEGKAWLACHVGFLEAMRRAVEISDTSSLQEPEKARYEERLSEIGGQLDALGIKLKPPEGHTNP